MPVKRKTINLAVSGNALIATDSVTGQPTTDAGIQGEDQAVWFHVAIPSDWQDLFVRLQVIALDGSYDESDYPVANAIDMPIRQGVTVPGRLTVRLKGADSTGAIRKTADCKTLRITESAYPNDPIPHDYPNIIRHVTGSGGAVVTQTDDNTYNVDVSGTGGDMAKANYANGSGVANLNKVDHSITADQDKNGSDIPSTYMKISDYAAGTGGINTNKVDRAAAADSAAPGSALATTLSGLASKPTYSASANGYYKDVASGIIFQWGFLDFTASGSTYDSGAAGFAIPFSTAVYSVQFSIWPTDITSWITNGGVNGYGYSLSAYRAVIFGLTSGKPYELHWFAIGN